MNIEQFFSLFLEELKLSSEFDHYYKFHSSDKHFNFRKAYFIQRLEFIQDQIPKDKEISILDLGCGYGTTALFLALNGYKVKGITLEFYFKTLEKRIKYWSQFGDVSGFSFFYQDLFDGLDKEAYDVIIAQDTLHHLEPLPKALQSISDSLKNNALLISVEENGSNWIQNLKLLKQRGFKKVKTVYDEQLKREILMGDENIRPLRKWKSIFGSHQLSVEESSVQYIRYFLPNKCSNKSIDSIIKEEQEIQKKNSFLRNFFFFGLNFSARKI